MRQLAVSCLSLLALGCVGRAAEPGGLSVSWEYSQPVLHWSNSPGQAYLLQSTSNLVGQAWQTKATVTAEGNDLAWADDSPACQAMFYRVVLSSNAAPFQSLQQALQRACTNQGIVGASAAAVLPSYGLWLGTRGYSSNSVPIRPETRFEFGSITKTFVAATVLRLVEEGRLTLDDTVGQWLPTLNCSNVSPGITVRQLLAHRAGVYNFGDDLDFRVALFWDWSRHWEPEEVMSYVKAPYFAPDTGGEYSNTGYVLLGLIIRSVTGSTVASEMRRTVFNRAGLRSTVFGAEEIWPGNLADPHLDFDGDGLQEDLGAYSQTAILTSFWTSGAVVSVPRDLARFGIALFEGGLLSGDSLTAMRSFQPLDVAGYSYDYGLGLMRFTVLGRELWAHSGGLFGEYAWWSYCPSTGVSLAVAYNYPQLNATGPSLPGELLLALSTLASVQDGTPAAHARPAAAPEVVRIPFLNSELPLP